MKRKLTILLTLAIILSQTAFGAAQNIKCISNPMESKDFTVAYADNQRIVTYSNGTFTVNNVTYTAKYTIPGTKDWITPTLPSSERYRLTRTYDKTSKLYTYSSLDILTGKQTFLVKTPTNIAGYMLSDNGKVLVTADVDNGIIANSAVGKSISNIKFDTCSNRMCTDSLYSWEGNNLYLIDLSTVKKYSVFQRVNQNNIIWAQSSPGLTSQTSVFIRDGDTLKGFFPKEKISFDITGIKNPCYITENAQETKLAIGSNGGLVIYNIKTRCIEKTIKMNNIKGDIGTILWSYDGSIPLLAVGSSTIMDSGDCNLYLLTDNNTVAIHNGAIGDVYVNKDSFTYKYGLSASEKDFYSGKITIVTCSASTGKIIKKTQKYADSTSHPTILRKEKDFTLYKDSNGNPFLKYPENLDFACTKDNQYCFISNHKTKGFYIYNVKSNKLYHADYNITYIHALNVIGNGKYAIILASDKHGNKYLNTFVLN